MKALPCALWLSWSLVFTLQIHAQSDSADQSSHQSRFVTVNNVKLHYLDWGGKGDTLLFLHGMGATPHVYDRLAPKFTNQFRVLGLTRRGHGQSEIPETGYDTATLVEDIRQFLDALKIRRVVLAGHSFAGDELTRFGAAYPGRESNSSISIPPTTTREFPKIFALNPSTAAVRSFSPTRRKTNHPTARAAGLAGYSESRGAGQSTR